MMTDDERKFFADLEKLHWFTHHRYDDATKFNETLLIEQFHRGLVAAGSAIRALILNRELRKQENA